MKSNPERNAERYRIVEHVRSTAQHILAIAMDDKEMDLERADIICTVLEDVADSIEVGDHWSHLH
jgi:hypothetical protein